MISDIHRGEKRVLQSVVIDVKGNQKTAFKSVSRDKLGSLSEDDVRGKLVESGMWTSLRTRPYSKIPTIDSSPAAIFVNAMDTNPLAADPAVVIADQQAAFQDGLTVVSRIAKDARLLFNVKAAGTNVPAHDAFEMHEFGGLHPAGLVGTHIHFLMPASATRTVWHLNYQDVIAMGHLLTSGELYTDRVISIAGPHIEKPRLIKTQMGAHLSAVVQGELINGEHRVISGSILNGTHAKGPHDYLGRYHPQVSVIEEDAFKNYYLAGYR